MNNKIFISSFVLTRLVNNYFHAEKMKSIPLFTKLLVHDARRAISVNSEVNKGVWTTTPRGTVNQE